MELTAKKNHLIPVAINNGDIRPMAQLSCSSAERLPGSSIGLIRSDQSVSCQIERHRTVHRPRVYIYKTKLLRHLLRDRAFSGPCRTVNCNIKS